MKTIELQKLQRKRQLTVQYMLAVALIFLVSLSSLLVLKHIMTQQEGYGAVINMSGRQRMLSQQIALLAHEIVESHGTNATEDLVEKIHYSINLMEQSHNHLISGKADDATGVELSETLYRMYFHSPLEVDRFVREYLAAIRALISEPVSEKRFNELNTLSKSARGGLLDGLDTVVKQYESESTRYSDILKDSALAIFLLMVLLLVVIITFGFRPMANVVVENESMLNSILDSIPILMDIVSKDGTILYQSKFLLDMLGESTIGQKCFIAYKTDQTQCKSCPIGQATLGSDVKITTCFDRLGTGTVVEITHLPIPFKGQEALLHTFQDITEQKKTEAFLISAKEEADHASEMKSNFLANMSHEIRTPMNAIIGFSDLALETELNTQQQDYLEKIQHSSHSLLGIINEILDFSKIEAGKLDLEKKLFCLDEILEGLTLLFGDKAQEKNIVLMIHKHADIPRMIIGDSLRLQQILVNLVSNSLKFTNQGEITIQVQREALSTHQTSLKFSVADTGIGIAHDKQATLFDSFSQADSSTTRKYGGTGLGLAISRQLVELLGGKIEVNSKEGEGTVFSFTVPFGLATAHKKPPLPLSKDLHEQHKATNQSPGYDSSEEEILTRIRGSHVLLVEDNPINRQVAEEILTKAGIILETAQNGQLALEKCVTTESSYDAILMDIQMPVMGGIACTQELRNREVNRRKTGFSRSSSHIPVIAMTANAMQGDREHYLQAGMDDYLAKPINRAELFRILARWIPDDRGDRRASKNLFLTRHSQERRHNTERRQSVSDRRQKNAKEYSLPENLIGIDLTKGLSRLEGNVGLYLRLLKEFATDYASIDREILEALNQHDLESAERLVHTIKGIAGSLGAKDLALASLTLEQAIKGGGQIKIQMAQFEEALQQVLHSLTIVTDKQQNLRTINEPPHTLDKEKRNWLITELETLLAGKNFQADGKWQELKSLLIGVDKSIIIQIDHSLDRFDYTTALELLAEIKINVEKT